MKKNKKIDPPGAGGVPQICFHSKSYLFCDLKPHAKFQKPTVTPSGIFKKTNMKSPEFKIGSKRHKHGHFGFLM